MTQSVNDVDVDWGGEHLHITVIDGRTEVCTAITPALADRMIRQLTWAAEKVRGFAAHLDAGGNPAMFNGGGKPS